MVTHLSSQKLYNKNASIMHILTLKFYLLWKKLRLEKKKLLIQCNTVGKRWNQCFSPGGQLVENTELHIPIPLWEFLEFDCKFSYYFFPFTPYDSKFFNSACLYQQKQRQDAKNCVQLCLSKEMESIEEKRNHFLLSYFTLQYIP